MKSIPTSCAQSLIEKSPYVYTKSILISDKRTTVRPLNKETSEQRPDEQNCSYSFSPTIGIPCDTNAVPVTAVDREIADSFEKFFGGS